MTILKSSHYNPSRGGHAPGDLREAFLGYLELVDLWQPGEPLVTEVELRDSVMSARELCGLLWNCIDIMPGEAVAIVEELSAYLSYSRTTGSTYARGARMVAELLDQLAKEEAEKKVVPLPAHPNGNG